MNVLKSFLALSSFILVLFVLQPNNIYAKDKEEHVIDGVVYGDYIFEVKSKEEFDSLLYINNLNIKEGKLYVDFNLNYQNKELNLKTSGDIYPSEYIVLNDNSYAIDLKDTVDFEVLSLTLEEKAAKSVLLPVNYDLTDKPILKIALIEKHSGALLYFEGSLSDSMYKNISNLSEFTKEVTKETGDKINDIEHWYWSYSRVTENTNNIIENPLKQSEIEEDITLLNDEDSFIPLMMSVYYRLEGEYKSTYRDAGGFYKKTVEQPAGSGSYNTSAIQWSWPLNEIDDIEEDEFQSWAESSLTLTHQGRFRYDAETREVFRIDEDSDHAITDPILQIGVKEPGTEIISEVEREATYEESSTGINYISLTGLLSYKARSIVSILGLLDYQSEEHIGRTIPYSDKKIEQEQIYGETIRGFSTRLEGARLTNIDDNTLLNVRLQVPRDENYERIPGERSLNYRMDFDIHERRLGIVDSVRRTENLKTYEVK